MSIEPSDNQEDSPQDAGSAGESKNSDLVPGSGSLNLAPDQLLPVLSQIFEAQSKQVSIREREISLKEADQRSRDDESRRNSELAKEALGHQARDNERAQTSGF